MAWRQIAAAAQARATGRLAPMRLAVRNDRPMYQGPLAMLLGPHRVDGGWWDRVMVEGKAENRNVVRDYFVALSEHAGVLYIFQTRLSDDEAPGFCTGRSHRCTL